MEWIDRRLAVAMQAIRFDECLGPAGEIRIRRLVGRRYAGFSTDRFRFCGRRKLKRGKLHFSLAFEWSRSAIRSGYGAAPTLKRLSTLQPVSPWYPECSASKVFKY